MQSPELCLIESRKAAVIHLYKARLAGGVGIVCRRFHGIGAGKQLGQDGLRLLPGGVAAQAGEREHRRNGHEKTIRLRACLRNVSNFIQCALPEGNHLFWSASSFCFLAM